MTQKEQISIAQNRDCMEAMSEFPDKYFELAIVDPPYGIWAAKVVVHDPVEDVAVRVVETIELTYKAA